MVYQKLFQAANYVGMQNVQKEHLITLVTKFINSWRCNFSPNSEPIVGSLRVRLRQWGALGESIIREGGSIF